MLVRRPLVWVAAILLIAVGVFSPSVVGAQDDSGFTGTITVEDGEGEKVPAEGIRFVVESDGAVVGEGVTDADGVFLIPVPAGTYAISIDTDSLPEGVSLRNPDRAQLTDLAVNDGQTRNVLFPLLGDGVSLDTDAGDGFLTRATRLSIDGLIFGLIIAMCSIGLSLIFGTTGLTNFAHGELVTIGALAALMFNDSDVFGLNIILAGLLAIIVTAGAGAANERFMWRPLRRQGTGLIAMLVISIGLSILVRYLLLYQAGGRRARYEQFALQSPYEIGPLNIVPRDLWIIGISVSTLLVVAFAVQRTKIGKAMRAVADNRDLAESSGIDVERVIMIVWIAGAGLAGLGGVLFGLNQGVSWNMGFELLLLMFAAVTLGGLGTAYGPLFGALVVGLFINLSTLVVAPELKNIGALLILAVILLVRPQGIFGQRERIG